MDVCGINLISPKCRYLISFMHGSIYYGVFQAVKSYSTVPDHIHANKITVTKFMSILILALDHQIISHNKVIVHNSQH